MATWSPLSGRSRSVHSVQALTEGAPADGDGLILQVAFGAGVGSIVPVVRAPAGQTFTGSGMVRAWLYVPSLARWVRAPRADDDMADATGLAEAAFTAIKVTWTIGRFCLIFEGCGVTGGTAPELDLCCSAVGGEDI